MKYPCISPYVKCYRNEQDLHKTTMINELSGDELEVSSDLANLVLYLDGQTDPYSLVKEELHEELEKSLKALDEYNMLKKNIYRLNKLEWLIPLFRLEGKEHSPNVFVLLDRAIRLCSLPIFLFGVLSIRTFVPYYTTFSHLSTLLGGLIGMIVGGIMHMTSHLICAMAAKDVVKDIGLIVGILPRTHVVYGNECTSSKRKKIHVLAAGILMNLLLAGIVFLAARYVPSDYEFFGMFGAVNMLIASLSIIIVYSSDDALTSDGMEMFRILSEEGIYKAFLEPHEHSCKEDIMNEKELNRCALRFAQILFFIFKITGYILITIFVICFFEMIAVARGGI